MQGDTRERRSRRIVERITKAVLARENVLDTTAVFSQILFIVKFHRDTGSIKAVQVRYHDDDTED